MEEQMNAAARNRLAHLGLCLALATIAPLTGCEFLAEAEDDECAKTVAPQVHSDVTFIVMASYKVEGEPVVAGFPYANCVLTIRTYKVLCEGGRRGEMDFSDSRTGADGTYRFTVGYNLNNERDDITADFASRCPLLPGFQSAPIAAVTNVRIGYEEARLNGNFARVIEMTHTLKRQ
jgi:hypothetical protein